MSSWVLKGHGYLHESNRLAGEIQHQVWSYRLRDVFE